MQHYTDPDRWLIVQAPVGAGAKLVCAGLTTIQGVAPWHTQGTWHEWMEGLWQHTRSAWLTAEPLHSWGLDFYSRTTARGHTLRTAEWNHRVHQSATESFRTEWHRGSVMVDFWHHPQIPAWWQGAPQIRIDAEPNTDLYRRCCLHKLFPWDSATGTGLSQLDNPTLQAQDRRFAQQQQHSNPWQFPGYATESAWWHRVQQDPRVGWSVENPTVTLSELCSFAGLDRVIGEQAERWGTSYRARDLRDLHQHWLRAMSDCL